MAFISGFLACITPKRVKNMLHAYSNYLTNRLFNYVSIQHLPAFIAVEPANFCMLRCPECPVGTSPDAKQKQLIEMQIFEKILNELFPSIHTIIFYFQGEPLLHPNLPNMIKTAKSKRLYTMTSTNAQLIDRETARNLVASGLDKIIISVDGITQESYAQYRRGGNLQKVISGIGFIHYWKKELQQSTPIIEVQCLRLKSNQHEWQPLKQLYKEWGADRLVFKTAQFYDFQNGNILMPDNERFCRYRQQKNGQWTPKGKLHNSCFRLWSGAVIDTKGNVLPCCFDKSGQFAFGNLHEQSFQEIWFGEKANAFRRQILSDRKAFDMCCNCTGK